LTLRASIARLVFPVLLAASGEPAHGFEVDLQQADASQLRLDAPASRIITLAPHLAELVHAAGAGDKLIATVAFSEYPASVRELPRIGDAFRLDIERIVALDPDLVIAWNSGNPHAAIRQLTALGIPVWSVEIRAPQEIATTVEALGGAAGTAQAAERTAQVLRQRLESLAATYGGAATLSYFYQVDSRPLFTVGGRHLISQGLALCGGRNIFAEEPGLAFQVSHESVLVANPDALFAPISDGGDDPLADWREWPAMNAVRHDALFLLPADSVSRATPRFLDSLELACKLLHRLRDRGIDEQPPD
jgi:iron complex transport system substrate-binding protein